jgi:hypothetical protein
MKLDLSKEIDIQRFQIRGRQLIKNGAKITLVQYKNVRSVSQNAMYWAILNCIASETGNTSDDMHEFFKQEFLKAKTVKLGLTGRAVYPSTKNLDTKEFTDYMDKVRHFASEELGIFIPSVEDKLWSEFYFKNKE